MAYGNKILSSILRSLDLGSSVAESDTYLRQRESRHLPSQTSLPIAST